MMNSARYGLVAQKIKTAWHSARTMCMSNILLGNLSGGLMPKPFGKLPGLAGFHSGVRDRESDLE